jgi:hypothetical protein
MELTEVEDLLARERPVPAPGFRGRLKRHLLTAGAPMRDRPKHLRGLVAACATSGSALLAVAVVGVAGIGPLAT